MKTYKVVLPVALALLLAGQAAAQSDEEERVREIEAREAEFAAQMREAEERLEEAARRVAELSQQRLPEIAQMQRYAFDLASKPRLGVNIEGVESDGPVEGSLIIAVTPGSAADDAGLRTGDIITAVNGESLSAERRSEANSRLLDFMNAVEEGDTIDVEYLRDGNVGTVAVEPRVVDNWAFAWTPDGRAEAPAMPQVHIAPELAERFRFRFGGWRGVWGDMEVVELSEGLGRYFGTDEGLLVISAPQSNAFQLQDGDVILSIDGREPSSVNHCMRILGSYQPGEKLTLNIMRDKQTETIDVEVPDDRTSSLFDGLVEQFRPVLAPQPPAARREDQT